MRSEVSLLIADALPLELRNLRRWVCWRKEKRNGDWTKPLYDAKSSTDTYAKTNDESTWASYEQACKAADEFIGNYEGIGFVIHGSDYVGIDFDGVIKDGTVDPYALNILSHLKDAYCEVSPSGTGLHAFIRCPNLPLGGRKFNSKNPDRKKYGIEIYSGKEGGRYFTCTGERFSGKDIPTIEDLSLVYFLISRFPDEHFKKLWMGDPSEYENDDSRVDLALAGLLARQFNGNRAKVEYFFAQSVPGHRDKWGRDDYRDRTLQKALQGLSIPQKTFDKIVTQGRIDLKFSRPASPRKGSAFDFVIQPLEGQTDGWFPLGSPSLVGGSSGSGKTTLMVDLCMQQLARNPIFGHATNGRSFLILMLDRGQASHERTMVRMQYSVDTVPIKLLAAAVDSAASQDVIDKIESCGDPPEVVFIEGIDMLVSDPNALEIVMPFMHEMQMIAEHYHVAIIGSIGAPKQKPKDSYAAKRDTIFGSAVWSRMAETIMTMQYPPGDDDTADHRAVCVLPRNAKAEVFDMVFENGRLAVAPEAPEVEEKPLSRKEMEQLSGHETAKLFIQQVLQDGAAPCAEVIDAAEHEKGLSKSVVQKAFQDLSNHRVVKTYKHRKIWVWELVPPDEALLTASTTTSGEVALL